MLEQLKFTGESEPEAVRNRDGSTRIVKRASSGMFARKADPPSKEEAQAAIVAKVTEVDAEGSSVLERILDNQIVAATASAAQPLLDKLGNVLMVDGKPVTITDPKVMMASAKAAQVVLRSAGLEQPVKEPVQQNRVEIVIIQPPDNMMNREVIEDKPHPPLVPKFAEVTEIRTNAAEDLTIMSKPAKPAPRTQRAIKQSVSVEYLMSLGPNAVEVSKVSKGISISAVHSKADNELPLRMTQQGIVVQGILRLASAWANNTEQIIVEVEQE
jgi:hypothetical protein